MNLRDTRQQNNENTTNQLLNVLGRCEAGMTRSTRASTSSYRANVVPKVVGVGRRFSACNGTAATRRRSSWWTSWSLVEQMPCSTRRRRRRRPKLFHETAVPEQNGTSGVFVKGAKMQ